MPTNRKKTKGTFRNPFIRLNPQKEPYDRVLIVCEGQTEHYYFNGLRDHLKIGTANIKITPSDFGTDPLSVVNYALELYEDDKDYDRVYCVFDRDTHETYDQALNKIYSTNLEEGHQLISIVSTPCFEIWIYLHFKYSTKSYAPKGKKSGCDCLTSDLKKEFPKYHKTLPSIFEDTQDKLKTAIKNAKKLERDNKKGKYDNPSTQIHHLIDYLQNIKKRSQPYD